MAPISAGSSSRSYLLHEWFKVVTTLTMMLSLIVVLLPKSGESVTNLEESRVVIGSKPPACANKCMKCRPCMPTVVIPKRQSKFKSFKVSTTQGEEDDSYYLLSWKCRCGDKFFQP
ncbi:EPIDERMAL PATTERNING FACTOR-like protein 1 [Lotus japonicus]|uniref:EPIDERMAL PATTERNING FACTOR-like protein 1 n=1 Tax=Lotus japonicus TaxID=34305 RepID=UPI0025898B59|nr:EPIDERMAL PATTERNING FACTOR-like protein 1 [Lotus japonicus]